MIVTEDIYSVDDIKSNVEWVIRQLHDRQRPALLTADGKPDVLMIPVELLGSKQKALEAACALLESV
jgi:hypothetical protein